MVFSLILLLAFIIVILYVFTSKDENKKQNLVLQNTFLDKPDTVKEEFKNAEPLDPITERAKDRVATQKGMAILWIALSIGFFLWLCNGGCGKCYDYIYWKTPTGQREQAEIDRIHKIYWDSTPDFPNTTEGFERRMQDINERVNAEIRALQRMADYPGYWNHK